MKIKKIINGKRYDTEKAELICSRSVGYRQDFQYLRDSLYKTKKGNFFLAGEGGGRSKYAQCLEGNPEHASAAWGSGDGMSLVTEDEAKAFIEKYGSVEDYEKYFETDEA